MEDSPKAWRACYRHPKKPSSLDCAACGKPICGDCVRESGDPALCPACKEAATPGDKAPEAPPVKPPRPERTPLTVSEVTIHDDGRVVVPRKAKGKMEVPRDATTKTPTIAEEELLMAGAIRKEPSPRPIVKRPIPEEVGPGAKAPAKKRTTKPVEKERKGEREAARKRAGPTTRARSATTTKQLEAALPYGLAACIGVLGFWLVLALIRHSWTQTAVFTTGIAVPWALTKGSTVKKKMGIKVWKGPPHPAWIGLLSVGIMLPLVALAEFLAYKIVSRGTHLLNQGSKFVSLRFDSMGIFLAVSGFVLAFGVPYVLRIGEGWRAPSLPGGLRARVAKVFKGFNRRAAK